MKLSSTLRRNLQGLRRFSSQTVKDKNHQHVVPSYARFDLVLSHGKGSHVWDTDGKKYLDYGGGIAVNSLGHAHPEMVETIADQAGKIMHMSNLYYHESQGRLAAQLTDKLGAGKVFFANSGAEANEGMYKLARKHGKQGHTSSDEAEGNAFEVITMNNSFHGRTLGGIAATGQEKIKAGFFPMPSGFRHVPFNDLQAVAKAIGPRTAAVLLEGIQGEGGIVSATPEFLLGLRQLCDQHNILLMMDGVQCGHFRTGQFQSYSTILEGIPGGEQFRPDAVSMAKSLGGGFPIGAFWVRQPFQDTLCAGSHGTTYGGNPLGCTIASKIMDIVERDDLAGNAKRMGEYLTGQLLSMRDRYPHAIEGARGRGLMLGVKLSDTAFKAQRGEAAPSIHAVRALQEGGVLAVPSGADIVRLLPALNTTSAEADEFLSKFEAVISKA